MSALVAVEQLAVEYRSQGRTLRALSDIELSIAAGEALGIVGESGSGKSTLARAILGLVPLAAGRVQWFGRDLSTVPRTERRRLRGEISVVFQDPVASLDPRFSAAASIAEPLGVHQPALTRAARERAVAAMLERVGLDAALGQRRPHQLSGGQCQRVAIARAMITRPKLVICDEVLSALDVGVQAQIVNLLAEFRREQGTALLFISHNLAVVRRLTSRVLVLYLGRVMEAASREALFAAPLHPYTRLLLDSVPSLDPARRTVAGSSGESVSPFAPPSGCVFQGRCRHALAVCAAARPAPRELGPGHQVACVRAEEGVAGR